MAEKDADVTTNSGAPVSRSRRSPTQNIDVGRTTITSRDFAQDVAAMAPDQTGNAILQGVSGALGAFFGGMMEQELEKERIENDRKAQEAIVEARLKVQQNRDKADEALHTGDYSFFIPDNDLRQQKVVQQSFERIIAQEAAIADYDAEGDDLIRRTPAGGNPREVMVQWASQKVQGASTAYKAAYINAIQTKGAKTVDEWHKTSQKVAEITAMNSGKSFAQKSFIAGQVKSIDEMTNLSAVIAASLPMPGPRAMEEAQLLVENMAMSRAAQGDPMALKLINEPDPSRDGQSIRGLRKLEYEQLMQQNLAAERAELTREAASTYSDLRQRAEMLESGAGAEGDNWQRLLFETWKAQQKYGTHIDNPQLSAVRNQIQGHLKDGIGLTSGVMHAMASQIAGDPEARKALEKGVMDGSALVEARRMYPGKSDEELQGMLARGLGINGLSAEGKSTLTSRVTNMTNQDDAIRAVSMAKTLAYASGRRPREFFADGDDGDLSHAYFLALSSNPGREKQMLTKLAAIRGKEGTVNPKNAFMDLYTTSMTNKKMTPLPAHKIFTEVHDDVAEAFGLSNERDLSPAARQLVNKYMNLAAYVNQGDKFEMDRIKKDATNWVRERLGVRLVSGGKKVVDIANDGPGYAIRNGQLVKSEKPTIEEQEAITERLNESTQGAVLAFRDDGRKLHSTTDAWTNRGGGYAVHDDMDMPVAFSANGRVKMAEEHLKSDPVLAMLLLQVEPADQYGDVTVKFPAAPPKDGVKRFDLNDDLTLMWNDEVSQWQLRSFKTREATTPQHEEKIRQENKVKREQAIKYGNAGSPTKRWKRTLDLIGGGKRPASKEVDELTDASVDPEAATPDTATSADFAAFNNTRKATEQYNRFVAALGSPVPDKDYETAPNELDYSAIDEMFQSVVEELSNEGAISERTKTKIVDEYEPESEDLMAELDRLFEKGEEHEVERANPVLEPDALMGRKGWSQYIMERTEKSEGLRLFAYDDGGKSSVAWRDSKKKGAPTIGIGFNLNREDADKQLRKVGSSKEAVMNGERLNERQARDLFRNVLMETAVYVRNRLKEEGIKLKEHQFGALVDLVYNGGTSMLGKSVMGSMKNGDWENAEREIRFNSLDEIKLSRKYPVHVIEALRRRRHSQADWFKGIE